MQIHPVTLVGRAVRLEPLSLDFVADLAQVGLDPCIWRYMVYGEMNTEADLRDWVQEMLSRQIRGADLPFVVVLIASGKAVGATRYMMIQPEHRSLEIGGTWYGLDYQGGIVNAETKYLMLTYAFERLGALRVQIKTDARNIRSQKAIEKLGAVREGVLRQHMISWDGSQRDSVIYSIIDSEWPVVKQKLIERIGIILKG